MNQAEGAMAARGRPLPRFTLHLSRGGAPARLGAIALALILVYLALLVFRVDRSTGMYDIFSLREKVTFQNAFSSFTLLGAAALLALIAGAFARVGARDVAHWRWLAIGFAAMSLDRIACIHQLITTFTPVSWEIPGAFVVAAIGLAYLGFLRRLPGRARWWFLGAATVYVTGVIVVEALANPYLLNLKQGSTVDDYMRIADEGPQMIGAVLFVFALLDFMSRIPAGVSDAVRGTEAATPFHARLETRTVIRWLAAIGTVLVLAHCVLQGLRLSGHAAPFDVHYLFDVAGESSIPNWFMAVLLAMISLVAGRIADARRRAASGGVGTWRFLAFGFAALAVDRPVALHDWAIVYGGMDPWAVALVPPAIALLATLGLMRRLAAPTRGRYVAAGMLMVAGALVMVLATSPAVAGIAAETPAAQFGAALGAALGIAGDLLLLEALSRELSGTGSFEIAIEVTG